MTIDTSQIRRGDVVTVRVVVDVPPSGDFHDFIGFVEGDRYRTIAFGPAVISAHSPSLEKGDTVKWVEELKFRGATEINGRSGTILSFIRDKAIVEREDGEVCLVSTDDLRRAPEAAPVVSNAAE